MQRTLRRTRHEKKDKSPDDHFGKWPPRLLSFRAYGTSDVGSAVRRLSDLPRNGRLPRRLPRPFRRNPRRPHFPGGEPLGLPYSIVASFVIL